MTLLLHVLILFSIISTAEINKFRYVFQDRSTDGATEIVHEMMTASYFCLADDLHCTFAEHLNKIGAMSKALQEEVDCLYRTVGPTTAVCKLTQVLE